MSNTRKCCSCGALLRLTQYICDQCGHRVQGCKGGSLCKQSSTVSARHYVDKQKLSIGEKQYINHSRFGR